MEGMAIPSQRQEQSFIGRLPHHLEIFYCIFCNSSYRREGITGSTQRRNPAHAPRRELLPAQKRTTSEHLRKVIKLAPGEVCYCGGTNEAE
jgi:hypothetical protein